MTWLYERLAALQFGWRDAIDVLMVAFIIYSFLHLIRGTKAMQMSIGLLFLAGAYLLAQWLKLVALENLFREMLFYVPFAIIVIFQQELRHALTAFGRNPLGRLLMARRSASEAEEIVKAAEEIAHRHLGALIVLERTQSLRDFIAGGRTVDSAISSDLLLSIFVPAAPLHDGAVIVQHGRIAAAGVTLPLSSNMDGASAHGTRHRAALGMAEETDALVIVVSEENQSIGAAFDGKLVENLSPELLAGTLRELVYAGGRSA
jgi:diadenylate cyclase